jgi:hypothetical protein
MLAQLEPQLPRGDRWAYEPKFDGFRGRLWRRGDATAQLFSRNGRDLAPWFPELTRAADILPRGTPDGVRVAIFYTKLHRRLLHPLLAADHPPAPPELRQALGLIDRHVTNSIQRAHLTPAA